MKTYWKIYGFDGHRQKASWWGSGVTDHEDEYDMTVYTYEDTGTHDYIIVKMDCEKSKAKGFLMAQVSDGYFEMCNVGNIVEITEDEFHEIMS